MVQIGRRGAAGPKKAKKTLTFHIDCSRPVEDSIMEIAAFEKFLMDKIKVEGKAGTYAVSYSSWRLRLPRSRCVMLDEYRWLCSN
jgi:large subunit ribosomal protein L22e